MLVINNNNNNRKWRRRPVSESRHRYYRLRNYGHVYGMNYMTVTAPIRVREGPHNYCACDLLHVGCSFQLTHEMSRVIAVEKTPNPCKYLYIRIAVIILLLAIASLSIYTACID